MSKLAAQYEGKSQPIILGKVCNLTDQIVALRQSAKGYMDRIRLQALLRDRDALQAMLRLERVQ